ncbi:rho GTPase-activating protein 20-like [Mastomys coucha]|uniref:rho GTPase-activating protein 20-like n=1 Tax=Mastomys coucha TaxID=35658 RepID=UPI001261E927|nr:rho GTPase-activating protein 20-like [Mastomys coucha]
METLAQRALFLDAIPGNLLLQGPVALRRGWRKKRRHLFLFNDVLVVSNNVQKKKLKVKYIIPLSCLWIFDYADLVGGDNSATCKSIFLFWPMENFVATFSTKEQKKWWCFFIQRSINEAKKRVENKSTTVLQVSRDHSQGCTSACA